MIVSFISLYQERQRQPLLECIGKIQDAGGTVAGAGAGVAAFGRSEGFFWNISVKRAMASAP
jgi:hypothetical protein